MLQSMTGYANKSVILELENGNKTKLDINIKSLNSRYFDITSKLPYVLNQLETDFIKIIKSKLQRGHIYFTIYINDQNAFKVSIEPAISTIAGYIKAANIAKEKFGFTDNISLSDILKLPNTFILEEKGIDNTTKEFIFNILNETLNELLEERKKEGQFLQNDIQARIILMHQKIDAIEKQSKIAIQDFQEKIAKKLQEINVLENQTLIDSQKQTLFLALDKMDIHEEITRFKSHVQNIKTIISSSTQEKGKQLDFIFQELAREINTITAKTNDAQIIQDAIAIKVEVEKGREQIQNIV